MTGTVDLENQAAARVRLVGLDFDRVTSREALDRIGDAIDAGTGGWVLTPNVDILRRFASDRSFARLCRQTTLRLADGMPLVWASRVQGTPLPERVAGSDLIWRLSEAAANRGHRVFFLGGNPGTAAAAAVELCQRNPGLEVAGVLCPPLGFDRDPASVGEVVSALREARPDIVFVALGCPKQERLILELRPVLPGAWFLGVGISFSFVCGDVQRAPAWMQRAGLEWLHRLLQEPGRLARRYLIEDAPFVFRLLGSAVAGRLGRGRRSPAT